MIYPHELNAFSSALDRYYQRVELNRLRLEEYANKDNANPNYINRVNEDLKAQVDFANELEEFIGRLGQEIRELEQLRGQVRALDKKYKQLEILALGRGVDLSLVPWVDVKTDRKWV